MLVLSRKMNESVAIGDNIKITIVGVQNGTVKIGFEVPDNVPVMRTELLAKTKFDIRAQRERLGGKSENKQPAR